MGEEKDFQLALELQKQFNEEYNKHEEDDLVFSTPKPPMEIAKQKPLKHGKYRSNLDEDFLNRTQNLVHPLWETLDPTPDIQSLFRAFDGKFFQERLRCVCLEWSKRMYSCAGICYSRSNRFGKDITIRLSEPLLKLRPRKDLVETMLHEMIHAYCFVLNIREGNGGHGPNFKKIMFAINKVAGTNITVYHTFLDEVHLYKQHWWRCNGSCQYRAPFFGYVKRTSNRAPSPNDQWWAAHQESCGGTFLKIKEPEKKLKSNRNSRTTNTNNAGDIRKFFNTPSTSSTPPGSSSNVKGFNSGAESKGTLKGNGGGTMLLNPKTSKTNTNSTNGMSSIAKAFPPTSYPGQSNDPFNVIIGSGSEHNKTRKPATHSGGNLSNVVGLKNLNSNDNVIAPKRRVDDFNSVRGFTLNNDSSSVSRENRKLQDASAPGTVNRGHLRDIWSKRFPSNANNDNNNNNKGVDSPEDCINLEKEDKRISDAKRMRLSHTESNNITDDWEIVDDDVMCKTKKDEVIALSSDEETDLTESDETNENCDNRMSMISNQQIKHLNADERRKAIKQEIMEESLDLADDSDIILIDDEYDDNAASNDLSATGEIADTSVIDEFFGEDTLLKDFLSENDVRPTFSRYVPNPDDDIITCPICQNKMKRNVFAEHLNGCTGIAVKILPPSRQSVLKKLKSTAEVNRKKANRKEKISKKQNAREILRSAGYTEDDLENIYLNSSAEEEEMMLQSTPDNSETSDISLNVSTSPVSAHMHRQYSIYKTTIQCPACAQEIEESEINDHLDDCLEAN